MALGTIFQEFPDQKSGDKSPENKQWQKTTLVYNVQTPCKTMILEVSLFTDDNVVSIMFYIFFFLLCVHVVKCTRADFCNSWSRQSLSYLTCK